MARNRAIAILLATQLIVVLLLTQPWYSISMSPNGTLVTLGQFSGADANPSALATAIFALLAILLATFLRNAALRVCLAFVVIANSALAVFVAEALSQNRISALDGALDRLTGIAQSHGIQDLHVETSWLSFAWLVSAALSLVLAVSCLIWQRNWLAVRAASVSKKASKVTTTQPTTIDLWDDQRK